MSGNLWGGMLNEAAILLFLFTTGFAVWRGSRQGIGAASQDRVKMPKLHAQAWSFTKEVVPPQPQPQ